MMTTAPDANVHARRHRRHLRRLPGAGEGHVQPPRLPRPRAPVRRQFDQLGAHRGAGGLLLHRGGGARRAAPQGRLHRADRKFRRRLCRLCRAAHGAAGRPAGGRHQRQRHPGAHVCHRRLRDARRGRRPPRRRWTSRSRPISSGCCSTPMAATPSAVARADGLAGAVAPLRGFRATRSRRCARCSPPTAPTRRKAPPPCAPGCARPAICADPHTAVALAVAEKETRDPAVPMVVLSTAHPAKFPRRGRGRLRHHADTCPTGSPICRSGRSASRVLPADQAAVERFVASASRAAREGAAA